MLFFGLAWLCVVDVTTGTNFENTGFGALGSDSSRITLGAEASLFEMFFGMYNSGSTLALLSAIP